MRADELRKLFCYFSLAISEDFVVEADRIYWNGGKGMKDEQCSLEGTSEVTLKQMNPGESGYVQRVMGTGAIRRRMLEMGLIAGTLVQVIKYAPLGDPIEICVSGVHVCLRSNEASCLIMKKAEKGACNV